MKELEILIHSKRPFEKFHGRRREMTSVKSEEISYLAFFTIKWVEQATRLCRAATRRSEREYFGNGLWISEKKKSFPVPSGQWPDGTGDSPVPPRLGEKLRLA